uniref:Uncharacterized protein n=1 Tax=Anopheles culicifacies TaxID=139723 RepID=A0A182LYZ0_9DIPT
MCLSSVPMLEAKHCTATKKAGTSTIGTANGRRCRRPRAILSRRRIVVRLPGRPAKAPPTTAKGPRNSTPSATNTSHSSAARRRKPAMPNRHRSHGSWAPHQDEFCDNVEDVETRITQIWSVLRLTHCTRGIKNKSNINQHLPAQKITKWNGFATPLALQWTHNTGMRGG